MQHTEQVITKEELLNQVWGYTNFSGDLNLVETAIKRLRKEIEDNPKKPHYIQTVWGTGYRYKFASGSNVFTSSCVAVKPAAKITQSGASLNITFTAKTAGTYIIGIKYDAKSVAGATAPNPTTVHYDFSTVGVPSSTSGLNLVKK